MDEPRGLGRALFAAVFLLMGGVLNIIYGIAAIGNANFFRHNQHYVFSNLKGWGWITLIIGIQGPPERLAPPPASPRPPA